MKKKIIATSNGSTLQDEQLMLGGDLMEGSSNNPERVVKIPVNTHIANHIDRIGIDNFAKSLLEDTYPDWMPKPLRIELKESL